MARNQDSIERIASDYAARKARRDLIQRGESSLPDEVRRQPARLAARPGRSWGYELPPGMPLIPN